MIVIFYLITEAHLNSHLIIRKEHNAKHHAIWCMLTHTSLAFFLWDIGKLCSPRSDIAWCSVMTFIVCLQNAVFKFEKKTAGRSFLAAVWHIILLKLLKFKSTEASDVLCFSNSSSATNSYSE